MDGKGRWVDNVFVERLWRSLKYEAVYLHAYVELIEARAGIGGYLDFYNDDRPHQALGYQIPRCLLRRATSQQKWTTKFGPVVKVVK